MSGKGLLRKGKNEQSNNFPLITTQKVSICNFQNSIFIDTKLLNPGMEYPLEILNEF